VPHADWLITGLEKSSCPLRNSSCPLKKFILPAREIVKTLQSKHFLKEASKLYLMPYSDDEEHSPSEFYYPDEISDETNDPNGRFEGENAKTTITKNEKRHEGFPTLPGDS
jgi:hypothetical protein